MSTASQAQQPGQNSAELRPIRKLRVMISGLKHAVIHEFSVAYKLVLSLILLGVYLYFHRWFDLLFFFAVTCLMLMAEMFNSAIETLCDFVEDRENEKIRITKDIAAAAVGVSIFLWVVTAAAEVGSLFWLRE